MWRWPKCYHVINWFFLPKPGFLEFIWIFSRRNHLKINISHILNPKLTKWISLNPVHQDLSNNTKNPFQFFQVKKWFNIQELLHHKPKRHETKPMHPSSSKPFQGEQECDLWISLEQNITNKLPSFINRFVFSFFCFFFSLKY